MRLKRATRMLRLSLFSIFVSCAALFSIAFLTGGAEGKDGILAYAAAGVFWTGLLLGQIFFWIGNSRRKNIQRRLVRGPVRCPRTVGLVTFGSSPEALAADILLAVSALAVLLLILLDVRIYWMITLSLSLLLLSAQYHCILNGKTYRYIQGINKLKKESKKNGKT